MPETTVIVVHLRRPRLHDPHETRRDPFWEFGSFGLTGCHSRNLMHPKRADELNGIRLAFVQGGENSMRLVYLSPPVKIVRHKNVVEATWKPSMPFCYFFAPLIVNNKGRTDFPKLKRTFSDVDRDTWARRFSSMYRTRREPLAQNVAREVVEVFDAGYVTGLGILAETYEEALPFAPPTIDRDRQSTYEELLTSVR